jgi:hypothetical protein
MSKTSNLQKLATLKVWIEDLKKNYKIRKQQQRKQNSKWLSEIEGIED